MPTRYICDTDHYNEVIARCASVKSSLWIGTADIKDMHVKVGPDSLPFLAKLVRNGSFRLGMGRVQVPRLRQEGLLRGPDREMKSILCNLGLSLKVLRLNSIFLTKLLFVCNTICTFET